MPRLSGIPCFNIETKMGMDRCRHRDRGGGGGGRTRYSPSNKTRRGQASPRKNVEIFILADVNEWQQGLRSLLPSADLRGLFRAKRYSLHVSQSCRLSRCAIIISAGMFRSPPGAVLDASGKLRGFSEHCTAPVCWMHAARTSHGCQGCCMRISASNVDDGHRHSLHRRRQSPD